MYYTCIFYVSQSLAHEVRPRNQSLAMRCRMALFLGLVCVTLENRSDAQESRPAGMAESGTCAPRLAMRLPIHSVKRLANYKSPPRYEGRNYSTCTVLYRQLHSFCLALHTFLLFGEVCM